MLYARLRVVRYSVRVRLTLFRRNARTCGKQTC